jgi:hypothetical protein
MDNKDVSLTISQDIVKPIVEAKIKEAMVKCFSDDPNGLIGKVIDQFLLQKVDEKGERSSYRNDYYYVDILLRNMINEALKDAVKSWVSDNQEIIKKAVYDKLNLKSTKAKMAGEIISGLINATTDSWSFKTEFKFQSDK